MCESHREQHPLLYEDLSEEDQLSPRSQRRYRPMVFKGRVRNKVKGAAAIIRLWPEHWSSSVAYWWMAIGMIGLTTFVVYNIVSSVALLPPSHLKEMHMRTVNDAVTPRIDSSQIPYNVYMHIFVENDKEIDLNNYLPYIEIIADKYPDFKYHLLLVFNDTTPEPNVLSAEENNENALNALWGRNSVHRSPNSNINIEHVTLSKYMDKSPLKEHWKQLPKQFIGFLTRAVSIWDKGGIAFNPSILTPRSPHAIYIEKLQKILKNFHHIAKKASKDQKVVKKNNPSIKKKVNNIRDIIDALEDDGNETLLQLDVIDPKGKKIDIIDPKQLHESVNFNKAGKVHHSHHSHQPKLVDYKNMTSLDVIPVPDSQETLVMAESKNNNDSIQIADNFKNASFSILPMFLEFLFRNKADLSTPKTETVKTASTLTRKRKHVLPYDIENVNKNIDQEIPSDHRGIEKNTPESFPVKTLQVVNDSVIETQKDEVKNMNQLTIDLKGNIVSSDISCHAFLGTMFSNAVHTKQESLTDFIIAELSIFCKGVLSSCNGIDVILL